MIVLYKPKCVSTATDGLINNKMEDDQITTEKLPHPPLKNIKLLVN